MKATAPKNQKLIKQYPFVTKLLQKWLEPYTRWHNTPEEALRVDDLTIKVERADGKLMFRRADNVGLGENSFIFQSGEKRKGQLMRRGEYAFAIDKQGAIINQLQFPRNREEQRKFDGDTYAFAVLWGSKTLNATGTSHMYSNPLDDVTKYIVWVTVEAWHADTKNDEGLESRFGAVLDRSVHITIYGEPKEGFRKLQETSNVYEHLVLDSHNMIRGAIKKDYDLITMGGMLYELCIAFQDEVYFNGMKEIFNSGEFRGASGQFDSVKVLVAEMCGYERIMIEDSESFISLQLRPDAKNLYVLGQRGTLPQLRNLIKTVIRLWNQKPELRKNFISDQNVTVM